MHIVEQEQMLKCISLALDDAAEEIMTLKQDMLSMVTINEHRKAVKKANYFESEAIGARGRLSRANQRTLEMMKYYPEDKKGEYDPNGNRNYVRDVLYALGDIRDLEQYGEDGATFKYVYKLVDVMSNGRFYATWNDQWAKKMEKLLPPPNGEEWKKLDLAVSNEYYRTLTEIAIDLTYDRDNKKRDELRGDVNRDKK